MTEWRIIHGDSLEVLKKMEDESVDALVTDPPAGISFMGKDWDSDKGGRDKWIAWLRDIMKEAIRVLKPGAHGFIWSLPRTSHWTAMALEDARFEVRDCVYHMFGSGFPKSLDVSKAIDKKAGAEREIVEEGPYENRRPKPTADTNIKGCEYRFGAGHVITAPATDDAKKWQGWGTSLKPAVECWWLVRKPFKGTVAQNVLEHGTGAINVDGCRVKTSELDPNHRALKNKTNLSSPRNIYGEYKSNYETTEESQLSTQGRFPANVILSHHPECVKRGVKRIKNKSGSVSGDELSSPAKNVYGEYDRESFKKYGDENGNETVEDWDCHPDCPIRILDEQSGYLHPRGNRKLTTQGGGTGNTVVIGKVQPSTHHNRADGFIGGGASRFFKTVEIDQEETNRVFYCAKPSKAERGDDNRHPTVKAVELMRYLCKMITPPKGIVLDPFCGSGSTGIAALAENFSFIGIDNDEEWVATARERLKGGWSYLEDEKSKEATEKHEQDKEPKKGQIKLF